MTIGSNLKEKISSMIMSHEVLITVSVIILVIFAGFGMSVMGARSIVYPPVATNEKPSHNDVYYATKSAGLYAFLDTPAPPDTGMSGTTDILGINDESIDTSVPIYAPLPTATPWPTPTPFSLGSYTTTSTTTSNAGSCIGQPTEANSQVYVSPSTTPVGGSSTISVVMNDCNNNVAPVSDQLKVVLTSGDAGTKINGSSSPVTIETLNGKATFPVTSSNATTVTLTITDATRGFEVTMPGYKKPTITFSSNTSGNSHCTTAAGVPNTWYSDVYPAGQQTVPAGSTQSFSVIIRDCNQTTAPVSDYLKITMTSGDPSTQVNGRNLPVTIQASNGQANFSVISQIAQTVKLTVTDTTAGFDITDTNNQHQVVVFTGTNTATPTPTPTPTPGSPTPTPTTGSTPTPTPTSGTPTPTPT